MEEILNLPKPIGTLDELLEDGGANQIPRKVFISDNLGYRTFLMQMPIKEFYLSSEVANDQKVTTEISQRKLDPKHAERLGVYILKGLVNTAVRILQKRNKVVSPAFFEIQEILGKQPYMTLAPIIVNVRNCEAEGKNIAGERLMTDRNETACFQVLFSDSHILWVVDGQHRRKGMQYVFEFLDYVISRHDYPKKTDLLSIAAGKKINFDAEHYTVWSKCMEVARQECKIAVEVHLGLDVEQERQLFYDLNNLGKSVEKSLALKFDSSNPINMFIKDTLIGAMGLNVVEKDIVDWNTDTGALSHKDIVAINAILFLNKTNISSATQLVVNDRIALAIKFWEAVMAIQNFGDDSAKSKTIAAQSVVLKALAKLAYAFAFGREKSEENLGKLLDGITELDFSHNNNLWHYYELNDGEKSLYNAKGLLDYLPDAEEGNRDMGSFQNGVMRFGSKHNDIYPIIGDMIRWKLNLPSRKK